MSQALAAHGTLIAIELDPVVGGTFTVIAEQTNELSFGFNRPSTEVTPHNDDIDSHVTGVMRRDPIVVAGNFLYANGQHDHLTGLQKHWIDNNLFGIQWRGPSWAAGADEIIASGHVTNFVRTSPVREGEYSFECTIMLSGAMEVDGVAVGTAT